MHQLKALVWKAYKLRLRSPLSTTLDVGGPIVMILIYLSLKAITGSIGPNSSGPASSPEANGSLSTIEPARDLSKFLCPKVLFSGDKGPDVRQAIIKQCGIELVDADRRTLIDKLEASLQERIYYRKKGNLNRAALQSDGCFTSPSGQISYQAGIVLLQDNSYEIHTTDTVHNPVLHQPYTQGSTYNELTFPHGDLNSGRFLLELCVSNTMITQNSTSPRWRIQNFPVVAAHQVLPILFLVFQLLANFCNALTSVLRATEDNESGLHHYIRMSGVSAAVYWTSHLIVISIHMICQSLLLSILLSIPAGTSLPDPIAETDIITRWLLLLTYSMSINMHALFVGSLFSSTSHSMLATCLLAIIYAMHPLTFLLQWTPYQYSHFRFFNDIVLCNPVSNYEALLMVMYGTYMQKNSAFTWSQLSMKIVGGGMSEWSMSSLWLLLAIQGALWFSATIFLDQLWYSSLLTGSPARICAGCRWLFCLNRAEELTDNSQESRLGGKMITSRSKPDPNRVCCSLKQVAVLGPIISQAYTRGDPFKLTNEQLQRLKHQGDKAGQSSKTHQYLVNRTPSRSHQQANSAKEEPIVLDEALSQHIMWRKTRISFENLNVDFRFNQVSFVLGQTSLKELFFATLLGLRFFHSGNIVLDQIMYTSSNLPSARNQIGLLSEKDVFLNDLNIYENLQFFGSLRDPAYTHYDSESLYVLGLLHLTNRRYHYPVVLTNRSARKLALAVAAVGHTKLLLLVEPTMSLRWKPRCQVLNLLKKYKSIRSIVVDTSDVDEAVAFGDRVLLLRNNRADLDGTPSHLSKRLNCGHWLVFEPITGDGKTIVNENVRALDSSTSELFKQDKIEPVDVTRRSVYEEVMKIAGQESGYQDDIESTRKLNNELLHRQTVIVKVQQSDGSAKALCSILKILEKQNLHGFRLSELTFESLEDILVFRMAKAVYPDLPPDLLLSLQHRTQRVSDRNYDQLLVSVRKNSSDIEQEPIIKPQFGSKFTSIIKDRINNTKELGFLICCSLVSLAFLGALLWSLRANVNADFESSNSYSYYASNNYQGQYNLPTNPEVIELLYINRIALYVQNDGGNRTTPQAYLDLWPSKKLSGLISRSQVRNNQESLAFAMKVVQESRDMAVAVLIVDPRTDEVQLIFDQLQPRALTAAMRTYSNLKSELYSKRRYDQVSPGKSTVIEHNFRQSWHEIIKGSMTRRFFYGIGIGIAEAFATGSLVLAPLRHRAELRVNKLQVTYLLAMATFDMAHSFVLIVGYITLIVLFDSLYSGPLIFCMLIVLLLYKLASLPMAYLVSLVAESPVNGFLFIFLVQITISWAFSIHLQTFVEWTLISEGYLFTIGHWIMLALPISSLIDSVVDMTQLNRINDLCSQVPAYTSAMVSHPSVNSQRISMIDKNMDRLRECLSNGKEGISTNVIQQRGFGILWDICLIILFILIAWTFLLFSERVFGNIARRFTSINTSTDPLKTIVRSPEPGSSLFKWDQEKDRLVSDYIRCMNEVKYVKQMASNCLYVRIWLKPLSSQATIDKNIAFLLEPMISLGQPKSDIQVELRTTLQLFIRVGSESNRHKLDRVQLIETYTTFLKNNQDKLLKFAVVDWTRETLYKILLHGHYNTKSATPST